LVGAGNGAYSLNTSSIIGNTIAWPATGAAIATGGHAHARFSVEETCLEYTLMAPSASWQMGLFCKIVYKGFLLSVFS